MNRHGSAWPRCLGPDGTLLRCQDWFPPLLFILLGVALSPACYGQHAGERAQAAKPILLAHYMPWYEMDASKNRWGWHWTMNAFNPNKREAGRREIASQLYPTIGPYDSGDRHVQEYHLLLMKLSGIDGVIVDWYGLEDFRDYALLHRNTQRLAEQSRRLKMQFAVCYEDQTVPALVQAKRLAPSQRVAHVQQELGWLRENWFSWPNYVRWQGRPVLLSFGQEGLSNSEWSAVLRDTSLSLAYFSQHQRRDTAIGAFDWPVPQQGLQASKRFNEQVPAWSAAIPCAYPRFLDIYEQAKVHPSWGRIEDRQGDTLRQTLQAALDTHAPFIQLATWNDWGEGTCIEPSLEYGDRDLRIVLELRQGAEAPATEQRLALLELPHRILKLRRTDLNTEHQSELDKLVIRLAEGKFAGLKRQLVELEQAVQSPKSPQSGN